MVLTELTRQLLSTATPLHVPGAPYPTPAQVKQRQRAIRRAHAQHTAAGIARYRVVMEGAGWMTSWEIECALGYARTVSSGFLRKLVKLKIIKRRPRGGEKYNRKKGWEYKWIS